MNLRRLRQWFALPDAARSPWKRRLVWGVPFVLVLSGVVAWRASRPVLGKDVELEEVSREEAVRIVNVIRRARQEAGFAELMKGNLKRWYELLRSERVQLVAVTAYSYATVLCVPNADEKALYQLTHETNGWAIKSFSVGRTSPVKN